MARCEEGWVKLYPEDADAFTSGLVLSVWTLILMLAAIEPGSQGVEGKLLYLDCGQLFLPDDELTRKGWGLSSPKIIECLEELKTLQKIDYLRGLGGSLISVHEPWAYLPEVPEGCEQRQIVFPNSRPGIASSHVSWRSLRFQVLRDRGAKCELCGQGRSATVSLHVDHIKPRSKYPHLALEYSNLQVLCSDCNLGKGNRDETDFRQQGENIRG